MRRIVSWLLCLLLPGIAFADPPLIQAMVGHPVVQELMGGCSLRCAFPWQTFAILPGKTPVPVYTLDDNDADTAWMDGVVGAKLTFQFPKKLPKELNDTPFYGFDIADGNIKSDAIFKQWGRVKKVRLYYNGHPFADVALADTRHWQNISFDDIMARQGDVFSMEILDVYPGTKYPTAAITELILQGAH
ncbi:MAG TPA: hypothetical protein VHY22_14990 [Chthoniobacteraceae bacterium]|nr:hypothetical protein [Chthoniobacteraceae bacterium]